MHYSRFARHGSTSIVKDWPRRTIAKMRGSDYVMLRVDNAYKFEHVVIAEAALGKPLPVGAVVHHMDRDGLNNNTKAPWNLVVCPDQAYHMLLHARARALGYEPQRSCDKLTAKDVVDIKASSENRAALAKRYGVTVHAIKAVRVGKRDIGYLPDRLLASGREFIGGDLI